MPNADKKSQMWRNRAEQARCSAAVMTEPGLQNAMLELAKGYERLAKLAAPRYAHQPRPVPAPPRRDRSKPTQAQERTLAEGGDMSMPRKLVCVEGG